MRLTYENVDVNAILYTNKDITCFSGIRDTKTFSYTNEIFGENKQKNFWTVLVTLRTCLITLS